MRGEVSIGNKGKNICWRSLLKIRRFLRGYKIKHPTTVSTSGKRNSNKQRRSWGECVNIHYYSMEILIKPCM